MGVRSTQVDPIGILPSYMYAGNNPVMSMDPFGLHHAWWHTAYQTVQRPFGDAWDWVTENPDCSIAIADTALQAASDVALFSGYGAAAVPYLEAASEGITIGTVISDVARGQDRAAVRTIANEYAVEILERAGYKKIAPLVGTALTARDAYNSCL